MIPELELVGLMMGSPSRPVSLFDDGNTRGGLTIPVPIDIPISSPVDQMDDYIQLKDRILLGNLVKLCRCHVSQDAMVPMYPTTTTDIKNRGGFALVVALALLSFVFLLLTSLSLLLTVERYNQERELQSYKARMNAQLGLRLALADLQRSAGPDQRVTARAEILTTDSEKIGGGKRFWTGVWNTTEEQLDPIWLVSGDSPDRNPLESFSDMDDVIPVARGDSHEVLVKTESAPDSSGIDNGRFGWWVSDEGVKASIAVNSGALRDSDLSAGQKLSARRYGLEFVSGLESLADDSDESEGRNGMLDLRRIVEFWQIDNLLPQNGQSDLSDLKFDLTTIAHGLLTSTVSGGLRTDLSTFLLHEENVSGPMWQDEIDELPVEGPPWSLVRDFISFPNLLEPVDGLPGVLSVSVFQPKEFGSINPARPAEYQSQAGAMPLVLHYGMTYGIFASPEASWDGVSPTFRLRLAVKPVIALWNPYDVALASPEGGYVLSFTTGMAGAGVGHRRTPRFYLANSFTDGYSGSESAPVFRTRNIHLPYLDPEVELPNRPYYSGVNSVGRDPIYSIAPGVLLPGEIAWFSLPPNYSARYEFVEPDSDDDLYGLSPDNARKSPVALQRGFNPESYLWFDIPPGPIGLGGFPPSEGTYADMGLVAFPEETEDGFSVPVRLHQYSNATTYTELESSTVGRYPIVIRAGLSSSGEPVSELHLGGLYHFGQDQGAGRRNKLMYHLMSSHPSGAVGSVAFEFFNADDFIDTLVTDNPINFVSHALVLGLPDWRESIQPIAHYNLRSRFNQGYSGSIAYGAAAGRLYQMVGDFGDSVSDVFDESRFFPPEALRTVRFGGDDGGEERLIGPVLFHFPREPVFSIGQLMDLDIGRDIWSPTYAIGNSHALPWIGPDKSVVEASSFLGPFSVPDLSYFANSALWDEFYFSGLSGTAGTSSPLHNLRLVAVESLPDWAELIATDDHKTLAKSVLIDGVFNVNSTSIEAWKAFFSSMNSTAITLYDSLVGESEIEPQPMVNPFPRWEHQNTFASMGSGGIADYHSWRSIPELSDEQIEVLAQRVVYELRDRGRPFNSLSEFINRELDRQGEGARDPRRVGLLQRTLSAQYDPATDLLDGVPMSVGGVNPRGVDFDMVSATGSVPAGILNPEVLQGLRQTGVPGYVLQADILRASGHTIAARSDTFIIRAYGSSGDYMSAHAWCEAVVQRTAEYIDPTLNPEDTPETGAINYRHGRRFKVVAFRWLTEDDI